MFIRVRRHKTLNDAIYITREQLLKIMQNWNKQYSLTIVCSAVVLWKQCFLFLSDLAELTYTGLEICSFTKILIIG